MKGMRASIAVMAVVWGLAMAAPAAAITLYRSGAVVMETLATEGAGPNQHPAERVDETGLARLFAGLQVESAAGGGARALLSEQEALELAKQLAKALGRVEARQDIALSLFRDTGQLGSPRRHATGLRVFVTDDGLNLVFGQVDVFLNDFREPYRKLPEPGSRQASAMTGGAVLPAPGMTRMRGRDDWLVAPLPRAAGLLSSQPPMPSAPAAAAPVATPAAAPATTPKSAPGKGSGSRWQDLEEGLETLERLRRKGLISESEHAEKRARLMQEAGL